MFCELPIVQVSLNEAREDHEAENQNVNACEPFVNQCWLTGSQNQYSCGRNGIWDIQDNQIHRHRKQTSGCWGLRVVEGGSGQMGSEWSVGTGFPLGVMHLFGTRWRWWLYNIVNVLTATELYTLRWLISYCGQYHMIQGSNHHRVHLKFIKCCLSIMSQ